MTNEVVAVKNLSITFKQDKGSLAAVNDVSISISRGKVLGVVGESGSGKTVTALAINQLLPEMTPVKITGEITFQGVNMIEATEAELRRLRSQNVRMIFQEPGPALNPVRSVGSQLITAIRTSERIKKRAAKEVAVRLFAEVGLPEPTEIGRRYPHQLSGGQQQRVMIAMALSGNPDLLIADEPTTALDVVTQAQILKLIDRLRRDRGMAVLFISHDFGVIAQVADDVAVMYRGELVEKATAREIFEAPKHAYTKGLLASRPRLDSNPHRLPTVEDFLARDAGSVPSDQISAAALDYSGDRPPRGSNRVMLQVEGLSVSYQSTHGQKATGRDQVRAVDNVSFELPVGKTFGLVGESGSGKTTVGNAILKLGPVSSGRILVDGADIGSLTGRALKDFRKRVQVVFQDPYDSLNPRLRVGDLLLDPMKAHAIGMNTRERLEMAADTLRAVGLSEESLTRYPHEFSGGQRQRIAIARALVVKPELIVCDEAVSALDVSVQAQVLNLLKELQERFGLTYLFISHDLAVVRFMSDIVGVMNRGKMVEMGSPDDIYSNPDNDYTRQLIDSIPVVPG